MGAVAVLFLLGIASLIAVAEGYDAPWIRVLPVHLPAFALGILLAVLSTADWSDGFRARLEQVGARPWLWWSLAGVLFLFMPLLFGSEPFPQQSTVQVVSLAIVQALFGMFLVIPAVLGPQDHGRIRATLRSRPLAWLGLISYGLYLWHWFVLQTVQVDWLGWPLRQGNWFLLLCLSLPVVIGAAAASWYLVERPILRFVHSRTQTVAPAPPGSRQPRRLAPSHVTLAARRLTPVPAARRRQREAGGMSWSAVWDAPRPFLHPVRTPAGALLTVEAPADHPWHHALWFSIKFVNGENFWEEYGEFGLLETREVDEPPRRCGSSDDRLGAARRRDRRAHRDPHAHPGRRSTTTRTRSTGPRSSSPSPTRSFDRTPFTTWGGYGGLTLRGCPGLARHRADPPRRQPPRPAARRAGRVVRAAGCRRRAPTARDGECGVVARRPPGQPALPDALVREQPGRHLRRGLGELLQRGVPLGRAARVAAGSTLRLRHLVIVHDGPLRSGAS